MKVVLDTNVFLSGVFFGGLPYEILRAWRDRRLSLVFSPDILDEYRRTGEKLAGQFLRLLNLGWMLNRRGAGLERNTSRDLSAA